MSRRKRIFLKVAACLAALALILVIGAILVMQTGWFRNFVREKIVAVTENSTGGKAEIGSFDFDWTHLRVTLRNFVLHGTEAASQPPLFRAALLQLDLKLFSGLRQIVDLAALKVDQPQANVIVYPDGRTNVPQPKIQSTSNKSAIETVVDLKIGNFDLANGQVAFNAEKAQFSAKGSNLRAQLFYNALSPSYKGSITMSPLYLVSGKNAPVNLNVNLPLTIEKDRIQLTQAKITTPESQILIDAAMDHLNAPTPHISGHLNAKLGIDEVAKLVNLSTPLQSGPGIPDTITADAAVEMDQNTIQVSTARLNVGDSKIEASGTLKDPSGSGAVQFNASLALGQIGRLLKVAVQPEGLVDASGTAKLVGQSDYQVNASVHASNLAFRQGTQRFHDINATGQLAADSHRIALNDLKLAAFGGSVTGSAVLEELARFHLDGHLANFDTRTLAQLFASQTLPYDGVIGGSVQASGDLKAPGTKSLTANAHLVIAPGGTGVPMSGRLNAAYNGAADVISVADSYVALPNTRVDLSGSLDRQLQLKLVSHNLSDFQPAMNMLSKGPPQPLPIQLQAGGAISFTGAVTGKLANPQITGRLEASKFKLEDRSFDQFATDVGASSSGVKAQNGSLTRGSMQLKFAASAGLHQWSPEHYEPVSVTANIQNADLADLLALAGQKDVPVGGTLTASAQIGGTIGNPRGNANLSVVNGTAYDEHFDRLTANVDFADQLVRVTNSQLTAGTARVDVNATFQHPKDSFSTGQLQLHVASNQMALDQFNAVRKQNQGLGGTVQLNADASGRLEQVKNQSEFLVTSVNANVAGRGLKLDGKNLGDLTATAQTAGSTVSYNVNSDFAGSTVRLNGQTRLEREYPTTATASIRNLPIEQVLAVAGRKDIPAKGNLSADANVSGTAADPQATITLDLTKAVLYQEPLDRVQGRIAYASRSISLSNLEVAEGPAHITVTGEFDHPAGSFETGSVRFHLASNQVALGRLHIVQQQKPGLDGILEVNADGAATLRKVAKGSSDLPLLITSLNATAGARGIQMNKKALGDLNFKAETQAGDLVFHVDSDIARSQIHGQGKVALSGDYPVNAQLTFANVTYAGLQPLLGSSSTTPPNFDALAEGNLELSGPVLKPNDLAGKLQVSKFVVSATPRMSTTKTKTVQLQNDGPIVVALKNQTINVQSGHLTGPETDIQLSGSVAFAGKSPLNLQVAASTNLKLLESFNSDIYSSGKVTLQAMVRGTFAQPSVTGELNLQNASVNLTDLPNGISNANGSIRFNGNTAILQNIKAESGGGVVTLGGFVGFANGEVRYGLRANAAMVRVRTPDGISVVASATANLNGTTDQSVLAGTVTVNRIGFNPRSDFGSLLSRAAPPVETPEAPEGPLAGMKLDLRIRTAPDVAVQTALAQNLQADADLTVRGTLQNPGMVGRVNVTSGTLIFFGTTYTVNDGSVSFFNPLKIDPILNVDLETKTQGVDVILTVSGPVNNMKLTYRSDPPLQFNEIVALLAAGHTPTSDPTILANQPAPPAQNLQQMGESAIVSQAIANPVSDRLARVFGVSQIKIDPTFTSGSALPQARLSLQQQVSKDLTFTYITDLTQSNSEIVQVQWALSQQWSAVATRDQTGRFGIDFFYKRQFR